MTAIIINNTEHVLNLPVPVTIDVELSSPSVLAK